MKLKGLECRNISLDFKGIVYSLFEDKQFASLILANTPVQRDSSEVA